MGKLVDFFVTIDEDGKVHVKATVYIAGVLALAVALLQYFGVF